jgi:cytochrome d ubiquinol oxidase subunit I
MIVLTLYACIQWRRKKLFDQRWLMIVFVLSVLLPQMGNQAGWFAAEMGRQPLGGIWLVANI